MGIGRSIFVILVLSGCSRSVTECGVPPPDYERLLAIRSGLSGAAGPGAELVLPNPIDASQNPLAQIGDRRLLSLESSVSLPGLLTPSRLESALIRMRIRSISDALSDLAKPDAAGRFRYDLDSEHYSEVLGYYSLSVLQEYVQALGFSLGQSRPVYAMVLARAADGSNEPNALYDHSRFAPDQPRTIRFYGDTAYKVAKDQQMFWHEFGHFINESLSQDRGIDLAGDYGANFTEGAALHESIADYGAESFGNRPYIGRWIARNFPDYPAGEPLRWAIDTPGNQMMFSSVASSQERYAVAEWCSRVLWRIREQFFSSNRQRGVVDADRLVYTAVTLLPQDSSITDFRRALIQADDGLHCGLHRRSIEAAFSDFGFEAEPDRVSQPLTIQGRERRVEATDVRFEYSVQNNSSQTARNVRVFLESDGNLVPTVYMQGLGDVGPRQAISIPAKEDSPFLSAVISKKGRVSFRLRVKAENADDGVFVGEIQP